MRDFDSEDTDSSMGGDDDTWVPDEALKGLVTERQVHPEETEEQLTRRLFRENSATAALGIIHVSKHGTNERTRLDASKYIIERVLGKAGDDAFGDEESPLEKLMKGVLEHVETFANDPVNHTASSTNTPSLPGDTNSRPEEE